MTMPREKEFLTIGQVAESAGVPATTLRYYEREGVLAPTVRSAAGYRLYDANAVDRLEFIRSAQAVGFTLDDVRMLLDFDSGNGKKKCKSEVQELIQKRLSQVEQKMSDLRRVRTALSAALEVCQRSKGETCPVLGEIRLSQRKATNHEAKHEHNRRSKKV